MYVVELTNSTASTVGQVPANSVVHFPADRCQWQQTYVEGALNTEHPEIRAAGRYDITDVRVYDGASVGGFSYNGLAARMGYIAKTGRFVAMTA